MRLFARINQRDGTGWIGIMALDMDAIRKAAERVATTLGLDVVDVAFSNHGKQRVLTVSLEKNAAGRAALFPSIPAESGAAALAALGIPESVANGTIHPDQLSWLTHEDCAAFSRDFGTLLDVENLGPEEEYTLEASSPGLDRSLSTLPEFVRFRGALVKIQTFEPVANNRHWQGRLTDADETRVALDLKATRQNSKSRKAGVDQVEITLRNIERAQLIPEF